MREGSFVATRCNYFIFVYKIPYRRARAWPSASKGIFNLAYNKLLTFLRTRSVHSGRVKRGCSVYQSGCDPLILSILSSGPTTLPHRTALVYNSLGDDIIA